MVGLLVATLQAVRHGDAASLWRVYLGVAPACVLAIFVARPIATLILERSINSRRVRRPPRATRQASLSQRVDQRRDACPAFGALRPGRRRRDRDVAPVVRTHRSRRHFDVAAGPRSGHRAARHISRRPSPGLATGRDVPRRGGEQVPHRDHADAGIRRTAGELRPRRSSPAPSR